ncbi:MAG: hypothetical protein PVF68_14690 [Acidobacteriota bacterium]|jgi:hypothetical protein
MTARRPPTSAALILVFLLALPALAGTKVTSTWSAPGLEPATYAKVAVLARFEDDVTRRILEDAIVEGLADRGMEAVPAYSTFTEADLADDDAVAARAAELGLDAGIVFTVTGEDTQVKSGSNVHASVGVPVRAGPFSVFVGTSVPLGGGTKKVTTVGVKSEFFVKDGEGPLWIATYSTDLKGGNEQAAQQIGARALKQMKKARLFE